MNNLYMYIFWYLLFLLPFLFLNGNYFKITPPLTFFVLFCSVASWAQQFGEELWDLGQKMTKSNEIRMVQYI